MNAWHKAMRNVNRYLLAEVTINCTSTNEKFPVLGHGVHGGPPGCHGYHNEDNTLDCPTKLEAIKNAKAKGWTYDKGGNWLCPECTKNNNKPTIQGG